MSYFQVPVISGVDDDLSRFTRNGADMEEFAKQLQQERNTRSLTFRREKRPSLARMSMSKTNPMSIRIARQFEDIPFLNPENAISIIQAGNFGKIQEICGTLVNIAKVQPQLLELIAKSVELNQLLIQMLYDFQDPNYQVTILTILKTITPQAGEEMSEFSFDLGSAILSILEGTTFYELIVVCFELIGSMAQIDEYSRDTFFCLGIPEIIIQVCQRNVNEIITKSGSNAIMKILVFSTNVNSDTLESLVKPITEFLQWLISTRQTEASNYILESIFAMNSSYKSLSFLFFDLNMFPVFVQLLDEPELVGKTLPILGLISNGHAIHVSVLLENGLLEKIFSFLDSEYAADAFWILTNLLDSVPSEILPNITEEFLLSAQDLAETASFQIKMEVTNFMASYMLGTPVEACVIFINEAMIDIVNEMLNYGVAYITHRCLDVIRRFSLAIQNGLADSSLSDVLRNDDLIESLNNLQQNPENSIAEYSKQVSALLESLDM